MSTKDRFGPNLEGGKIMEIDRLSDMLERYGEVCTQKEAARILSIHPRSVHRMMEQGRLRRVGHRVDVRSIAEYIENCGRGLPAPRRRSNSQRGEIREGSFFAAARANRWSPSQG
jgi:hypothetical protein